MSRWPLIVLAVSASAWAATAAQADAINPTSVGPRSDTEAALLWKEGRAAYDSANFADAARTLQRFVDRYPSAAGFTEAHLLLGVARIELGQPAEALPALKYYVQAYDHATEGAVGRLHLARAYLDSRRPNEAVLTATEVLKRKSRAGTPPQVRLEAVLLKAEAQLQLNRDLRAAEGLDTVKDELAARGKKQPPESAIDPHGLLDLGGQTAWLELRLKLRACARLPGPGRLDEGQARDQIERRGICLLEASLPYRDTLNSGIPHWAELATTDLGGAFRSYGAACSHPPDPPGKRSARQLGRYRSELTLLLQQECRDKYAKALDLMNSWKEKLPGTMTPYITRVTEELTGMGKAG